MKNDTTVANLLEDSDLTSIFDAVVSSESDFESLVLLLGLDKASDFRFSNLNGVDFSYSNLKGYDFSGADLRNSYGIGLIIDDTTNFNGADLQGSCFATYQREQACFRENSDAVAIYEALRSGDPYEISDWLHERYGGRRERHALLRRADAYTASVLCQKLLTDEIDLTKRTVLFHFLGRITKDKIALRELILDIVSRHYDNAPVIEKFIGVASKLYGRDPVVFKSIVLLCRAREERIRDAAFKAVFQTKLSIDNVGVLKDIYMSDENVGIRKRAIFVAASALGRRHLSSVDINASMENTSLSEILDYPELLVEERAIEIAISIKKRGRDIEQRLNPREFLDRKDYRDVSRHELNAIIERQEEVLYSTPVIKMFFASEQPLRAKSAMKRIEARTARQDADLLLRISRSSQRR